MTPAKYPLSDEGARRRIRESLGESLIVEASAGTGKTTELVKRIVAVLEAGKTEIKNIAAVTFTHKAAGELKLRLRQLLDESRHGSPILEEALKNFEEASIGTIHSFCAQILRERPVEAGVDPGFEELSEPEAARLYQRSFRSWLERQLNTSSPGLKRAFARLAWPEPWESASPLEQLQWAGRKLVEWRDYSAAWGSPTFAREEEIDTIVRLIREASDLSAHPRRVTDNLYRGLAPVRALSGWIDRAEAAGPRDYDALEAMILKLGKDLRRDTKKGSGAYGEGVAREDLLARRDDLLRWIEEFRRRADADLAALLRDEMSGLIEEYKERKRRAGKLDFVDLLISVRDLVRDQSSVRAYLQNRFTHLFVDEFQDTDPLQAEILLLLSADDPAESDWMQAAPRAGKLFLVGDPKQSIYKFRRADVMLYRQVRDALVTRGVGLVSLTRSFRALPNIQAFINRAFESEMTGDSEDGHADWAPLERDREELAGRPSVVVLPVPRPYKTRLSKEAVNACLPDTIAAFIAWLVKDSKWTVSADDGERQVQERDIAVLFRRRTQAGVDLTREYARALEARGVAHLLAGSKSFHHREEVETLRAALTAVEWPDDEVSVFATLKGSLFAIPDDLLLRYRYKHQRLHPFRNRDERVEEGFEPIAQVLDLLRELHRGRNHQPFAATVNALIESTRAQAGFVLRPGGNQILANVMRVADLARSHEMNGGISFRGFVEELASHAEKEEAAEAPVLEEDSDGVRLMTVHGAKGLEFPVVILADMTANIANREPDQYVDAKRKLFATRLLRCAPRELAEHESGESSRERAEGVRVAYVAATRARDLLVIPAVGDEPFPSEGWLSPLHKTMYPSRQHWRRSSPAAGCPQFGAVSVLARPLEYDREEEFSVRPGLIQPEYGDHEVVWWDPSKLNLNVEGGLGLRQKEILADDGGASLAAYREWQQQRAEVLRQGVRPRFDVFLASQAVDSPPGIPAEADFESTSRAEGRPGGRRFGTLVHAVLRDVALNARRESVEVSAALNARILGAPDEERDAARAAVEACLAHPLLDRARNAERRHREYPVVLPLSDGRLLEGVIDLAFVEEGIWIVIDFKTDADSPERRVQYQRQLQWYCYALAKLTGIPAQACLLGV